MGYEVDFLPVGGEQKSGDAICLRFGNLHGARSEQFVMVIDGGTAESGAALVEHIKTHYGTDRVDLVVSTHPDNDHVSGLRVVLDELAVGRLWMHRPWLHASDYRQLFKERTLTTIGLKRRIRMALDTAVSLENLAIAKGVPIDEPFSDYALPFSEIGIRVLGPSSDYYESLLPQFRETPQAAAAASGSSFLGRIGGAIAEVALKVAESLGVETLVDPDDDATSAENNSSVVLTIDTGGKRLLFTADAGVPALTRATDSAERSGINLPDCSFVQVPHHGSRRNVGPTLLNRMLGPKGQAPCRSAFISCPTDSEKHPSRRVCNAFQRRGAQDRVFGTKGQAKRHYTSAPDRSGWSNAVPLPFYTEVED